MDKTQRVDKAVLLRSRGFNCAQAVAAVFADLASMPEDTLVKAASGFGTGMGCMEATCGALAGAVMIAGLAGSGTGTPAVSRKILASFKDKCGGTVCKDLKGIDTGKALCDCESCIKNAVCALAEVYGIE